MTARKTSKTAIKTTANSFIPSGSASNEGRRERCRNPRTCDAKVAGDPIVTSALFPVLTVVRPATSTIRGGSWRLWLPALSLDRGHWRCDTSACCPASMRPVVKRSTRITVLIEASDRVTNDGGVCFWTQYDGFTPLDIGWSSVCESTSTTKESGWCCQWQASAGRRTSGSMLGLPAGYIYSYAHCN